MGAVILSDGVNATQRSSITEAEVRFQGRVDIDPGAFQLLRQGAGGGLVATSFSTRVDSQGNTVAILRFSGSLTRGADHALVDGNYHLLIDPTKVRVAGTLIRLDGDADGQQGGVYSIGTAETDGFFAYFGDIDGDRDVDAQDFGRFGASFQQSAGEPGYDRAFDSDGDGDVDGQDYGRFLTRLFKKLGR